VEQLTSFLAAVAACECPAAFEAVFVQGVLAVWLFGYTLRLPAGQRAFRLIVRGGPDFQSPAKLATVISATSVLPFLACPRLCTRLSCLSAAMDGYFPGKDYDFLPVPDLALPCIHDAHAASRMLLFDISGGLSATYASEERVRVIDLRSWEKFTFKDCTASTPEAFEELFARGARAALTRNKELDSAMLAVFGARPRLDMSDGAAVS